MMRYIGKLCVWIEDDYFVILMLILRIFLYFWKIFITPFVLGSLKERINSR